jgi:hypothetical protein
MPSSSHGWWGSTEMAQDREGATWVGDVERTQRQMCNRTSGGKSLKLLRREHAVQDAPEAGAAPVIEAGAETEAEAEDVVNAFSREKSSSSSLSFSSSFSSTSPSLGAMGSSCAKYFCACCRSSAFASELLGDGTSATAPAIVSETIA